MSLSASFGEGAHGETETNKTILVRQGEGSEGGRRSGIGGRRSEVRGRRKDRRSEIGGSEQFSIFHFPFVIFHFPFVIFHVPFVILSKATRSMTGESLERNEE
jgi:hypothetical protein